MLKSSHESENISNRVKIIQRAFKNYLKRRKNQKSVCFAPGVLSKKDFIIALLCIDNNISKANALNTMQIKYPHIYNVVVNDWDNYYNQYRNIENFSEFLDEHADLFS